MDIQISSNFERLLFEAGRRDASLVRRFMAGLAQSGSFTLDAPTLGAIRQDFDAGSADEAVTAVTIRETYATGELLDPHTAVGYAVARRQQPSSSPMITLATAHPSKFPDAVARAAGIRPALPERLAHLLTAEERFTLLPNEVAVVREFILSKGAQRLS